MKILFSILILVTLTLTCRADDQTRRVQAALSEAGFYFGTADGKMGEDTRAALRRFQIRNGLDVSGNVSPETLAALKISTPDAPSAAATDEAQIASTVKRPEEYPIRKPAPGLVPKRPISENEDADQPVQRSGVSPTKDFFADTDLEDSDADEQDRAVRNAQKQLVRLGYYRSAPNGLADAELETALLRFQHTVRLRLTGRLDADTRRALVDAPPSVPSKSFRRSENRPPVNAVRGIWIR